ncbi:MULTISPECIES: SMI1/KNR4 family protein [Methylobacter]|uniref:SMI1/KNR4 family protein n=1 Tax=Methylobacter TaxID=429 RepID=UPI00037A9989|nr:MULTISPECIES: SMI1/KNR4 family protein [Methylobacter]
MVDFVLENISFDVEIPGEPISEKDLSDLEAKLGTQLPSQLRSYYLRWNGGIPLPSSTPEDKSVWVRLYWKEGAEAAHVGPATSFQGLYKINSSIPGTDFLDTWNDFKHRIPQDCLCFARDPGGSQFLIGIKDYNLGKIYFWERSYQADIGAGELPGYDNIADVANSFVEFLLALREEPDEGESLEAWVKRVYPEK